MFTGFKYAFSKGTRGNLQIMTSLLAAESCITVTMRLYASSKHDFAKQELINDVLVPCIFGLIWVALFAIAYSKGGEYGAPPSLFYIQEQEALRSLQLKYPNENM